MSHELKSLAAETDALFKDKPEVKSENCFCAFWRTPISKQAQAGYTTATGISVIMGAVLLTAGALSENAPAIVGGVIFAAVALASGLKTFDVCAKKAPRPSDAGVV